MTDDRGRLFGYEAHHIFPETVLTRQDAAPARELLASIGYEIQAQGNKVPLLISPIVRDSIQNAPLNVQQVLVDAGFGFNSHDSQASGGNHPGYNKFVVDTLVQFASLSEAQGWSTEVKERAVFDLHRFLVEVNKGTDIPLVGTSAEVFESDWQGWKQSDYQNLSADVVSDIDGHKQTFIWEPINNTELRHEITQNLLISAENILTPKELANAQNTFNSATNDGSNNGHATSAAISIIHDLQKRSSTPITSTESIAEYLAAQAYRFIHDKDGSVQLDPLIDTFNSIFAKIGTYADSMAETLTDFW